MAIATAFTGLPASSRKRKRDHVPCLALRPSARCSLCGGRSFALGRLVDPRLANLFAILSEGLCDPSDTDTVLPLTCAKITLGRLENARAMLLAVLPFAVIFAPIRPSEDAPTFFLVGDVVADITPSVFPRESSGTAHSVALPVACELAAIVPSVCPLAVDLVVEEVAVVGRALWPCKLPYSVLLSGPILALETRVVRPLLNSMTLFLVVLPLTDIPRAVCVVVDAFPVGLVITPLALVDVPVGMHELAEAFSEAVSPLAIETGAIWPLLHSVAVPLVALPLSSVLHAVFEEHGGALYAIF
mmetsp:Transcript_32057/g.70101  ORF Transcript_32057/g.70101 Transcript_32057/m.70101 type:complete len:301 (+) Transcript_32057:211-1113(+)